MPGAERPAPLVLVARPDGAPTFGTHAAVASEGQRLLAADMSRRLGRLGAAVRPIDAVAPAGPGPFHWGRWYVAAAREALAGASEPIDAIGYVGAGALALLGDEALDELLSPIPGEVVANNRFSADAFVVAGDLDRALETLAGCGTDNAAPRRLRDAGFAWRDLGTAPWARFDVDTTLDLALLRVATRLDGARPLDAGVRSFLEMARLPGDRPLEVPHLATLGEVVRDRSGELVVAGRIPGATLGFLETETACRVRAFVEERGMRSARGGRPPRSLLAALLARSGPSELIAELASLGDGVVLDTRVLMSAIGGSSETAAWPPEEERFASDFSDASRITTPWLRELAEAAVGAPVPVLFGGHALVSDGLRLIVAAAWQGRG